MILAIAILCVGGQRSNADIEARRHNAAYFSPTMERMMRATDKELLGYAGSLQPEMRGAAVSEIVDRKLKSAAPVLAKQLDPAAKDRKARSRPSPSPRWEDYVTLPRFPPFEKP